MAGRMAMLAMAALLAACSTDAARRVAYETLENVGQQECRKAMSPDCGARPSYDDYQRQRKALESAAQ